VINDNITELEYFEWVINGKLKEPFKQSVIDKLKEII